MHFCGIVIKQNKNLLDEMEIKLLMNLFLACISRKLSGCALWRLSGHQEKRMEKSHQKVWILSYFPTLNSCSTALYPGRLNMSIYHHSQTYWFYNSRLKHYSEVRSEWHIGGGVYLKQRRVLNSSAAESWRSLQSFNVFSIVLKQRTDISYK